VLRANAEVALDLGRTCVHTDLLEEIVRESAHMTRLVEDLLLLARSEAGALPFEWEMVNLQDILLDVAERANLLVTQHHLALHADLPPESVIQVDRARLTQALLILLDNAAHYSPVGTEIMLRSTLGNREVLIEVADQGPGIAQAELPLIFERFYRTDKARTRRANGAGLGLAIAKSIIAAHGGRIEVVSIINQGTTMQVYLPLKAISPTLSPPQQLPANLTYSV
jgi:signal transduction histidine kinase